LDDEEQYILRLYSNQHLLRVKRVLYQISYYSDDVQSLVEFHELSRQYLKFGRDLFLPLFPTT